MQIVLNVATRQQSRLEEPHYIEENTKARTGTHKQGNGVFKNRNAPSFKSPLPAHWLQKAVILSRLPVQLLVVHYRKLGIVNQMALVSPLPLTVFSPFQTMLLVNSLCLFIFSEIFTDAPASSLVELSL